jgi:FAD-linked oxidoreductase
MLLTLDGLRGVIDHDPQNLQATVWAGTPLRELGPALWERGQSLINQGDVDPQTLAGACATSTHGTGRGLGSFSSAVRGLRLVTVTGEVLDVDAGHEPDIYQASRTSLGALGIATRIRLQNAAAYRLREREFLLPRHELMAGLERMTQAHRHFEFWLFFEAERAIVKTLDFSDAPDTPPARVELPVSTVLKIASRIAHGVPGMAGPMQRLLTALHGGTDRSGPAHRIFPSARDCRFNEMEYELPIEHGPACLDEILHTVRKAGLPTLFPLEYRTVAADDAWLSPFYGRDSASISVHQYHRADWRPLFAVVEPILRRHGGRPHWGKLHTLTAGELAPLYPRWDDFARVRRRLDPQGRLLNPHLRAVLGA